MLSNLEIVARLALAALLGGAIGYERERLLWAAGLRTHMLVCVGACLLIIVSAFGFQDILGTPHVELDPSRIAAQVVSGIGFLGAGTILLRGEVVKGLTTAASLWTVAAVGLAAGAGLYVAALATAVIVLVILAGLKPIEDRARAKTMLHTILVTASPQAVTIAVIDKAAGPYASRIKRVIVQPLDAEQEQVTVSFARVTPANVETVSAALRALPGVVSVSAETPAV